MSFSLPLYHHFVHFPPSTPFHRSNPIRVTLSLSFSWLDSFVRVFTRSSLKVVQSQKLSPSFVALVEKFVGTTSYSSSSALLFCLAAVLACVLCLFVLLMYL